eukprot:4443528-Pleurochrysis_carterae.AAC.1
MLDILCVALLRITVRSRWWAAARPGPRSRHGTPGRPDEPRARARGCKRADPAHHAFVARRAGLRR